MNKSLFYIVIFFCILLLAKCQKNDEPIYSPLKIQSVILNVSEFGLNDGAIDITVSGGNPPFIFNWSNNQITEDINNLMAGSYSVIVTDQQNQLVSDTFDITEPLPDTMSIIFEYTNPSETGADDGSITSNIDGGYPPFTFSWSNGAKTKDLNNLQADIYILTVLDSRGQYLTDSVLLYDNVKDINGNIYATVKIGNQTWMKENLRVTHAPDSSSITSYVYNNNTNYEKNHGRLYTWDSAMNGSTKESAQGICPCGWHIPSDEEFKELEMYLGMTQQEADLVNIWRGATIGTQLKLGGTSGFDAQLSGRRSSSGSFSLMGRVEYYWSSTELGNYAWRRCLDKNAHNIGRWNTFPKSYGFSIRCVKDD